MGHLPKRHAVGVRQLAYGHQTMLNLCVGRWTLLVMQCYRPQPGLVFCAGSRRRAGLITYPFVSDDIGITTNMRPCAHGQHLMGCKNDSIALMLQ